MFVIHKTRPRVGIVTKLRGSGGMNVHAQGLIHALKKTTDLQIFDEAPRNQIAGHKLSACDYVIRYGWRHDVFQTFQTADFQMHTLSDPSRNVLIICFDATMLNPDHINQINSVFENIWCDSEFTRNRAITAGIDPTRLSLVLPPLLLWAAPPKLKKKNSTFRYLHVSNELLVIKGVDIILQAFSEAFTVDDHVTLTLKLSNKQTVDALNPYLTMLERQGRINQIEIIFGKIPHWAMPSLYATMDCYVLASRQETFGLPALEAAFCDLQVIMHTWGGMSEYADLISYHALDGEVQLMPTNTWRENIATSWFVVKTESLAKQMQGARESLVSPSQSSSRLAETFSLERLRTSVMTCLGLPC